MPKAAAQLDHSALEATADLRDQDMVIPRIAIEAFCTTPDFANAMQTAGQDRRMAKAKTSVGMGGVASAVKRYANVGTPHLIIVETEEEGFGVFSELEDLAQVCDPETRVVVAGPSNDVTLYRELMRQGVCEYLVTPAAPLQIIEAVSSAYEDPEQAPAGKIVAVYGARGGVGSSVISHNLADVIAAATEKQTVLVDLDLEFGTAALDFNVEPKTSVADALSDIEGLDDVKLTRLLFEQSEHLKLLAAPASFQSRPPVDGEAIIGLLDAVRFSSDYVVLDLPRPWSDAVRTALLQADQVVLVASPDLASLRNLKSISDWLKAEKRHDAPPRIILNQVGQAKRPEISTKEFAEIVEAPVAVEVPYDPALFGAAQNDGKMLSNMAGSKRLVEKFEPFAADLIGLAAKGPAKPSAVAALMGLFGKG